MDHSETHEVTRLLQAWAKATTGPDFQAAQCLAADGAHRGRQIGSPLKFPTGRRARPRADARTSQSCHPASGPQAGRLSDGRRQKRETVSTAHFARQAGAHRKGREEDPRRRGARIGLSFCGQRSAGCSSRFGDWAGEFTLPLPPSVCFEASRLTLTQFSWTTPRPSCSRQLMSGSAAALAAPKDRWPTTIFIHHMLGGPVPPSAGESPPIRR